MGAEAFIDEATALDEYGTAAGRGQAGRAGTPLCDRCLLMYRIAVANKIPVRHQQLDKLVNEFMESLK
ncbi:MAG: hypothetical protein WAV09_03245 [Minisyncoccia bacterium]